MYEFPPYCLLPLQRQLLREGLPMKLGARAFDVLLALIERHERTVAKSELLDLVWPKLVVEVNNLEVQVVALRKLLGYAAIATVPGRGYRFTLPLQRSAGPVPDALEGPAPLRPMRKPARPRLPGGGSPLFGREQDVQRLEALVASHRLITVAGPTGIGKTRLALALAQARLALGEDVWWVDLAPMTDTALIAHALAVALGLGPGGASDNLQAVMDALEGTSALIVLDNAEHLLEGVSSFVVQLKRDVPGVRLLITSQEPLRVEDECVYRPEPLSLPAGDEPERIAASAAVALFVARAQAVDRRFDLGANGTLVADICRRLDGLPLAIELAAARLPMLGILGLRDKLDQRFHILTSGRRSSLRRHQTLLGALEWSYQLLSPPEQTVLRSLSVFAGGFTLEAAQQIAEDEPLLDRWDVLEHLGALIEKSLVAVDGDEAPRYRLLETTRLFALERLIESGAATLARSRHRDHYLALAEDCEARLLFGHTQRHLARLDAERDNLLLALAWAPGLEDAVPGLRLAAALQDYWFLRAMPARGAEAARAALDRPGAQTPGPERCRALLTAGWMSMWSGEQAQAKHSLAEALELARRLSQPCLLCLVLTRYANVHLHGAELPAAQALATEAIEMGRPLGDSVELGYALVLRAHLHAQHGDWHAAERLYREALALRERLNIPSGAMAVHLSLAGLFTLNGGLPMARAHLQQALDLLPVADSRYEALCLIGATAQWAAAGGQWEPAVLLDLVESRLFTRAGFRFQTRRNGHAHIEQARRQLPDELLEHLAHAAAAMSHEQALQRARSLLNADL